MPDVVERPESVEMFNGRTPAEQAKAELEAERNGTTLDDETPKKQEPQTEDTPEENNDDTENQEDVNVDDESEPDKESDNEDTDDESDEDDDIESESNEDDDEDAEEDELDVDVIAKAIAEKDKISLELAKEDAKQILNLIEQRGTDPVQLTKSILHANREIASKNKEIQLLKHAEEIKPAHKFTVNGFSDFVDAGNFKDKRGNVISKDDIIRIAKEEEPDIYEDLEDDKVFKLYSKDLLKTEKANFNEQVREQIAEADNRKDQIISNYSKDLNPEFKDAFTEIIKSTNPSVILSGKYNPDFAIEAVKGHYYDRDIETWKNKTKTEYKRGYNDGLKQKKIVKKGAINGGGKGASKGLLSGYTPELKSEALSTYKNVSEQTALKFYKESHSHRFKKTKKE